jgi:tetratricopeptide (TPR) repeat protein
MLAHHYLQALELAEAAGIDSAALGEPARLALRDAGDRAAALHSVPAAESFYDAGLRLWPEDDPERARLLLRRAVPVKNAGTEDAERLTEAVAALLAVGDRESAGEAELLLGQSYWLAGRHDLYDEHTERGFALLADAPPSRVSALALLRRGTRAYFDGDAATAAELAEQGRALAEEIRWEEGVSEASMHLGMARIDLGDQGGMEDIDRSIAIAAATGALTTLSRTYNTLAVAHQVLGDLDSAYEARSEGARIAERLGRESAVRWFEGVLVDHHYRRGEWDEAGRMAEEFLARVEEGESHYGVWQDLFIRAEMRLARGDAAGALADAEQTLELARAVEDPQAVYFALAGCAHVFAVVGERERALPLARELIDARARGVDVQFAVINLPHFAAAARELGLSDELLTAVA